MTSTGPLAHAPWSARAWRDTTFVTAGVPAPRSVWSAPVRLTTRGNNTFPAVSAGLVVFTTDRRAARPQRDGTRQVYLTRATTGHR